MSGPIFGFCSEHLLVVFRGIGFIRSQTRRNSTTSTIAEANIDITQSIFVHSRQRSTAYRLKRSRNVAHFPCGVNSSRLQYEYLFTMFCYFAPVTRHSVQTMCTMFSRIGCLTVCSEFSPETNAEPRRLTSLVGHDGAICAAKHLELVHAHH